MTICAGGNRFILLASDVRTKENLWISLRSKSNRINHRLKQTLNDHRLQMLQILGLNGRVDNMYIQIFSNLRTLNLHTFHNSEMIKAQSRNVNINQIFLENLFLLKQASEPISFYHDKNFVIKISLLIFILFFLYAKK